MYRSRLPPAPPQTKVAPEMTSGEARSDDKKITQRGLSGAVRRLNPTTQGSDSVDCSLFRYFRLLSGLILVVVLGIPDN